MSLFLRAVLAAALTLGSAAALPDSTPDTKAAAPQYRVQPGDVLSISVWQEPNMQREAAVDPDGRFAFPLAGTLDTTGKTVDQVRDDLTKHLEKDLPGAAVTVAVKEPAGNKIYVIGKVNRPGEFVLNRYVDVMQALSMAGGGTPYADLNDIHILRRVHGRLTAIPFDYGQVAHGRRLDQNGFLQSGDTIVVP